MKTIITLMAISIIQTTLAASYFEQEKDLAKKTLAKRETSAKMEMRETEASIIKSSNDIKFVIHVPGKEDTIIGPNQSNRNEFQRMYTLNFDDYLSEENINEGL